MKIRFTPEGRVRARAVAVWWRAHGMVPDLFDRELAEAQERVLAMPSIGTVYREVRGRTIRRVLMPKTQQYFYYSVEADSDVIVAHMIWGVRRGREPQL